jgi:hypothetical protein
MAPALQLVPSCFQINVNDRGVTGIGAETGFLDFSLEQAEEKKGKSRIAALKFQ